MKKKLKNYPFILLILLSLYSCLNEDVVNKMEHHHKYGINTVSINDIPSIIPPIERFNKNYSFLRNNINGYKTAKFENLNLDLDNIVHLNESQYNSYSIRILDSKTEAQYYFENLHIIENDTLTYSFITKWYPENPNNKFELKTFSGIMKKYDLQYNFIAQYDFINGYIQSQQNNQTTGKYTLECDLTSYCGCSGNPEWCGCDGSSWQCRWVVSYACYLANDTTGGGNDGGNNDSGTGGTSGGGGGSSQNDSDNNPFVPNPPEELNEEEIRTNPCDDLNNLTSNTIINNSIKTLRNKTNENKENAITFGTGSLGNVQTTGSTSTSQNSATIKPYPTVFGVSHTHQDGIYPMFTPGDLLAPCAFANNYIQPTTNVDFDNAFFNMMVVESNTSQDIIDSPNGFVYAIIPNDVNSFKNFISTLSDRSKFNKLNRQIELLYQAEGDWNMVNQLKLANIFLSYINNITGNGSGYSFNISLFRKPLDANYNPTGSWEKLTSNPFQPNGIKKTPCN